MNYLNNSAGFHDVQSYYSGTFSHVPSQPARISSPRSMLSCDKRLQPETWDPSVPQENVLANPRLTLEVRLPRWSAQGDLWQERMKEKEAQFHCRLLQEGRRPWGPLFLWIFHRVLAINSGYSFPEFWDAGRENCFCFEEDHPEFLLQDEGQSGGTEGPEGGSVSTRKTDRLHDLRLLSSDWRSWYSVGLCWLIRHHSSQRWCAGPRCEMGRKFYNQWQEFHQMTFWKGCTNWEYVSPRNSKSYWSCPTWRFIRKYRCPVIRFWRQWWRGV